MADAPKLPKPLVLVAPKAVDCPNAEEVGCVVEPKRPVPEVAAGVPNRPPEVEVAVGAPNAEVPKPGVAGFPKDDPNEFAPAVLPNAVDVVPNVLAVDA
jgi:hypothetical protein